MSESTALRPVVLLHGIDDTSALFHHMVPQLELAGLRTHAMNLVPRNGDAGLDHLAAQVAAWIEANFAAEQSIDLVGFSMGGLVARYYIQRLGGVERVRRFITMSSPHKGTWTAFLRWNRGARQMRPRGSRPAHGDRPPHGQGESGILSERRTQVALELGAKLPLSLWLLKIDIDLSLDRLLSI
jgi:pimeloyl-ACP methyl ester carboxylesterase